MDPISSKTALASAGAGGDPVYVDDVFSTYLYDGTGAAQTITNGIDLSGEGGMVLQRRRSTGYWFLNDTENGANNFLYTNFTNALSVGTSGSSFNSDGFTIGSENNLHNTGDEVVSWTFRKAPRFFDVVTYTGTGSVQNISHNLGSVPGMIIIKETSNSGESWGVYHRSLAASESMLLNDTAAAFSSPNSWNSTAPTASVFTVGTETRVNASGESYVAYLFAHDDQSFGTDGDEAIVHCGTFNGGGVLNSTTIEVDTGFEPQFVLIKRTDSTSDWYLYDVMRSLNNDGSNDNTLFPNKSDAEGAPFRFWVYQNGFAFDEDLGGTSAEWIYMAIRRPNKPVEAGTDVFAADYKTGGSGKPAYKSGFPVDMVIREDQVTGATFGSYMLSRLTGTKQLATASSAAETNNSSMVMDYMNGFNSDASSTTDSFAWMFKRAPGFMDVVLYTGTGSARTINHNLGVPPELMIQRERNDTSNTTVYGKYLTNSADSRLLLNLPNAESTNATSSAWNNTEPTADVFSLAGSGYGVNESGINNIIILFASLDGISKVGSYTGTGSAINVDCGFTAGARFVLIKRTDSTGDWYVWDSTRGIVTGNDPYLLINSTAAEVTNTDYIDPLNAGFTVTSSAPAALNASGGTYLFLAIA